MPTPLHAVLQFIGEHKAMIVAALSAALLAVVPDQYKPAVTAIATLFGAHAVSSHATSRAVEAHLKRKGL